MAVRSSFFNSVNGDRRYLANNFAEYFASFIANGIFPTPSNTLQVYEKTNMTVTVKPGKAWINGYFAVNEYDYDLTLDNADGVLNRIDRIVMRLDFATREIQIIVKKGTFASSPVVPTLQRDADAYELALADIYIGKGVTAITQANITDQRLNTSLCGIVHGTVDQVDTSTIFNQYQSWYNQTIGNTESTIQNWLVEQEQEFNDWFQSIQNILDDNVASNLLSIIDNHKADLVSHGVYGTATGTNALVMTVDNVNEYVEGMLVAFKNTTANTGAVTLNINSLGTKPVKKSNGNDLSSGNLKAGGVYQVRYDGSSFILLGEGGEYGTAVANDVKKSKTLGTENGVIQGTLDLSNLVPSNIKKGITIDGVSGSVIELAAGDTPIATFNGPFKNTSHNYIEVFALSSSVSTVYRITYTLSGATYGSSGRTYKNGVEYGPERLLPISASVTYTEDIPLNAGDRLSIYTSNKAEFGTTILSDINVKITTINITKLYGTVS